MNVPQTIHNREYNIKAWTIGKEKELLLEVPDTDVINKVHFYYKKLINANNILSYQEKLYSLVDLKTKISSDTINISYTCDNCKQHTEATVNISESIKLTHVDSEIIDFDDFSIKLSYAENLIDGIRFINTLYNNQTITDKYSIQDFVESMDINDYDRLNFMFSLMDKPFVFEGTGRCLICGHEVHYSPTDEDLINTLTSISLMEYYPLITNLKSYGFSISEIENLFPFELELIISTLKKQNNNQGNSHG